MNERFILWNAPRRVEKDRYRTGSGSDRMLASNADDVVTLFGELNLLSVGSGRYRSRFRNKSRRFTAPGPKTAARRELSATPS